MEKLKKTRKAHRGWVTRASKDLSDALAAPSTSISQLEHLIKEYDQRLSKLDAVQEAIELEVAEEELEQVLDEAHGFRKQSMQPRILVEDKIRELVAAAATPPNSKAGSVGLSGGSSSQSW